MKKKELIITKENYKAYKELLDLYKDPYTIEDVMFIVAVVITSIITIVASLAVVVYMEPGILTRICGGIAFISLGEVIAHATIVPYTMKKLKFRVFKKEYPSINSKIDKCELELALNKVAPKFSEATIQECEDYYKCEEIKEEILNPNNREYKSFVYNYNGIEFTKAELEKLKQEVILIKSKADKEENVEGKVKVHKF